MQQEDISNMHEEISNVIVLFFRQTTWRPSILKWLAIAPLSIMGLPLGRGHCAQLSQAMPLVAAPTAFIHITVGICHHSLPISLAARPLPIVDIPIGVCHCTLPMQEGVLEISCVQCATGPAHSACATGNVVRARNAAEDNPVTALAAVLAGD